MIEDARPRTLFTVRDALNTKYLSPSLSGMRLTKSALLVVILGACGGKAAKKPTAQPATAAQPVPAQAATATPVAASPNVAVSSDLAAQCKLTFASTQQAPKFEYNDV